MKPKTYDQLLQAKLGERMERLERESLLTKVDRLFARCNPLPGWSPMVGYAFDRERIKRFDDQRHEIVHGKAIGKPLALFQVSDENLFYVQQTGMYLMGLVNLSMGYGSSLALPRLREKVSIRIALFVEQSLPGSSDLERNGKLWGES